MAGVLMRPTEASRHLERAAQADWSWASSNCLLMLGDWIDLRRGTDLGTRWRALALDERGCRRAMMAAGGIAPFVDAQAMAAGLARIAPETAEDGDVGVISVRLKMGRRIVDLPVGALRCGPVWGALTQDGLMAAPGLALVAWRV